MVNRYENNSRKKARIFNIQKYNMYDGPGIRTMIFFKGCPLGCKWCSNPEGLKQGFQIMLKEDTCRGCGACAKVCPVGIHKISATGKHIIDRSLECIGCKKCTEVCLEDGFVIVGEDASQEELLEKIEEDEAFYRMSEGGVTLGGGEVLMQPEFAKDLLESCKNEGIHTAIETSGYAREEDLLALAKHVDLFLYDIKHMDSAKHYEFTGVKNDLILKNVACLLEQGYQVKVRMPILKGVNDQKKDITKAMEFLYPYRNKTNFLGVDLLPYHRMGVQKYKQLDMTYEMQGDFKLPEKALKEIEKWIKDWDMSVQIIQH